MDPPRPNERGNAPTSKPASTHGGEISLSIKSYIPEKGDIPLSADLTTDSEFSRYARRSKIKIDWRPERSWLNIDVTDQIATAASETIPEIVGLRA